MQVQLFRTRKRLANGLYKRKDVKQTIQFAIENWRITVYFTFENKEATTFYIQATISYINNKGGSNFTVHQTLMA
jgi:hypothetical protein